MNHLNFSFFQFQIHQRANSVDGEVIDGHIIARQALFTSSVAKEQPFETIAFSDNLKVTISFFTQTEGNIVKS